MAGADVRDDRRAEDDARTTIMLVFGGRSSEHSISCATAAGVLAAIDRERFRVIPVGITREGAWVLQADDPERLRLDPGALPEVETEGPRIHLPQSTGDRTIRATLPEDPRTLVDLAEIDLVFPILHGPFGEDGTLQGALELAGLPYVGSGVLASAAGMDKHYTKLILRDAGIRVAPGRTVTGESWAADPDRVRAELAEAVGVPMFVKPARAGSSVGVSKVAAIDELDEAMRVALAEDDKVLAERAVPGREVEIAILDAGPGKRPRASVAGEIRFVGAEFYDFESKYLGGTGVELVCPADLSESEHAEMAELGIRAFEALGGEGLARVDFFLGEDGFTVNEVNTMPGFTPISMFPTCWQASGLAYSELITELIEVALRRHAAGAGRRSGSASA